MLDISVDLHSLRSLPFTVRSQIHLQQYTPLQGTMKNKSQGKRIDTMSSPFSKTALPKKTKRLSPFTS